MLMINAIQAAISAEPALLVLISRFSTELFFWRFKSA
jgi:hypothetical protein